ncbi:hypothetical protein KIW84_020283 [Lathyrus oleraceus]|uniref:Uncharacterized protein n=1 Tax=Pisum sativum TaxID=3888 RepID=A0A9D5B3W1_PEA|nr:hypothetical protein KIW84_020283 [Pisum sativum]
MDTICIRDYIPWLDWLEKVNGLYRKAERIAKHLDKFIEEVIEDHILRRSDEDVGVDGNDFVYVLLSVRRTNAICFPIDKTAIKALILDMFAGGYHYSCGWSTVISGCNSKTVLDVSVCELYAKLRIGLNHSEERQSMWHLVEPPLQEDVDAQIGKHMSKHVPKLLASNSRPHQK